MKTGGAEVMLAGILKSMPDFNHVLVTLLPDNDFENDLDEVTHYCLDYHSKIHLWSACRQLRKILIDHEIDLIHSHLLTASLIARISNKNQLPMIFSVHNMLTESAFKGNKLSYLLEKYSYRKEHFVLFVSEEVKKDYDQSIGLKGDWMVLHNYVKDEFFMDPYRKTDFKLHDPIRMISIGTLKDQKNFDFLIHSLKDFQKPFKLDIYGTGPQENHLKNLVHQYELNEKIL
jgi:glycosyltransferase involved in cell wall biosynthesis